VYKDTSNLEVGVEDRAPARFEPRRKREARAVPSAFVGEGAALCSAKMISAATERKGSRETVGSWGQ